MIQLLTSTFQGMSGTVFQTLSYITVALGFYIALRCLKFPDLTVTGSFMAGQVISALFCFEKLNPIAALLVGTTFGAFWGSITALQHQYLRIPPFVCGIVSTFIATFFNFMIFERAVPAAEGMTYGEPQSTVLQSSGVLEWASKWDESIPGVLGQARIVEVLCLIPIVAVVMFVVYMILRSQMGQRMRGFGAHKKAAAIYTQSNDRAIFMGLVMANALVAFGGGLAAQANRLASQDIAADLLIPLLAAVVLGEFIVEKLGPLMQFSNRHQSLEPLLSRPLAIVLAPASGYLLYNMIVLFIGAFVIPKLSDGISGQLRSSHKYWITAFIIILVFVMRNRDRVADAQHRDDVI